jgi:hypothetical protein
MKIDALLPTSRTKISVDKERRAALVKDREYDVLEKKYFKALDQIEIADRLVHKAEQLMVTYPPVRFVPSIHKREHVGQRESAVLLLGCTHVGKSVSPGQTLGFGSYGFGMFGSRLYFLEDRTISILKNHVTPSVDELVVVMLGDMLDGNLIHNKEITRAMTLFDQYYAAAHCFSQFLLNLSVHVPKIRVYTSVGNHPRWANQKRMPTENRYSNLDHFLYALVKAMVAQNTRIEFNLDTQPFCYFDIKGTKVLGMHGDHLKGGDSQMGIPIHAISRQISGISQLYESRGKPAPHLWVMGDKHKSIQLPTIKGEFIVNGSFVGDDNFSLTLSTGGEPMQCLFGVHPKYRKSWEYKIKLIHAEYLDKLPYKLPRELEDKLI